MTATPHKIEWLPCPWCGKKPEITKHFKEDVWSLIHRCPVFTTLSFRWTSIEQLEKCWNTRYINIEI